MKFKLIYIIWLVAILFSISWTVSALNTPYTPDFKITDNWTDPFDEKSAWVIQKEEESRGNIIVSNDKKINYSSNSWVNINSIVITMKKYVKIINIIVICSVFVSLLYTGLLILLNQWNTQKVNEYKKNIFFIISGLVFFTAFSLLIYVSILKYWESSIEGKDRGSIENVDLNLIR